MKVFFLLMAVVLGREAKHELHVSYGNLGVEGNTAILQIRIFKDDLEEALRRFDNREPFLMEVTPELDAAFLRYLSEHLVLEHAGSALSGRILGSGYDELDREPVWWYQVAYEAPEPIQALRVTYTVLFEVFEDQRNVLRVAHFPEGKRQAFYFARGEETSDVEF
ncbi:MAG: hypothetical protein PVJ76_13955 [Gemmatimonadota bacterium]